MWDGEVQSASMESFFLHADIIDGKIWIQQDGTEEGLANQLVEHGVPKHDIVLAFDPPNLRQYTDFAVQ
jgi:hypothetical protein